MGGICRQYVQGTCTFGDRCKYSHPCLPQWTISCYAAEDGGENVVTGDVSFEEVMLEVCSAIKNAQGNTSALKSVMDQVSQRKVQLQAQISRAILERKTGPSGQSSSGPFSSSNGPFSTSSGPFSTSSGPFSTTTPNPFLATNANTNPFSSNANTNPFSSNASTNPFSSNANTKPISSNTNANPFSSNTNTNPFSSMNANTNPFSSPTMSFSKSSEIGFLPSGNTSASSGWGQAATAMRVNVSTVLKNAEEGTAAAASMVKDLGQNEVSHLDSVGLGKSERKTEEGNSDEEAFKADVFELGKVPLQPPTATVV